MKISRLSWLVLVAASCTMMSLAKEVVSYTYDRAGRLTAAHYRNGVTTRSVHYLYDQSGNLLRKRTADIGDADGDLMDDTWETDNLGGTPSDGTGDRDHDGSSDLSEYLAGTNPNDPASVLKVTKLEGIAGGRTITFASVSGKSYRVQYKDDLKELGWFDLGVDVTATGALSSITDLAPATGRFYRVEMLP